MAHVDYRVVASAIDDDVAKGYLDWLKAELVRHETFFENAIPPVVEMMEPAPGTKQPRVVVRFVFRDESVFARYNEEVGPDLRKSLAAVMPTWPAGPGSAPGPTPPAGAVAAPAIVGELGTEPKVTLSRTKHLVSRLPETGGLSPIMFGLLVILSAMFATVLLDPTFKQGWQQSQAERLVSPGRDAGATPTDASEPPTAPEPKKASSEEPAPKSKLAGVIERQSIGSTWVASYVALVGVLTVVMLISYQITHRNIEVYFKARPTWDALRARSAQQPGVTSSRANRPLESKAIRQIGLLAGIAVLFCVIGIQLAPPRPQVLVEFLSNSKLVHPRGMDAGLKLILVVSGIAAVMLATGFGTLLLPQQRWDPQPVPLSIHARLKAARFLLNAASACLVCGVIQIMLLLQLASPTDLTGDAAAAAEAFPLNYALASGAMFTVMLAGFYLPTVSALTAWGHRFVLLNSADKSHEEMVKDVDTYDAGVNAEFKPYLSVFAALAPAGAAVIAKLVGGIP